MKSDFALNHSFSAQTDGILNLIRPNFFSYCHIHLYTQLTYLLSFTMDKSHAKAKKSGKFLKKHFDCKA